MKKLMMCVMTACMLFTLVPTQMNAANVPSSMPISKTAESTEAAALTSRLEEINAMDKSNLRSAEKKQLRKEVRSIKRELKALSGGVYLSAGAIILIVVLIIVLL